MKPFIIIAFLVSSSCLFAQEHSLVKLPKNLNQLATIHLDVIPKTHYSIGLESLKLDTDKTFSIYNPQTQLNDFYSITPNGIDYLNTKPVFNNLYRGRQIDSFNPNGASDFGSAIVMGVLNSFINKVNWFSAHGRKT